MIKTLEKITLATDYNKDVEQMILAGKYDWRHEDITENHFPLPVELLGKKTKVSTKLLCFNCGINIKYAIDEMSRNGSSPLL